VRRRLAWLVAAVAIAVGMASATAGASGSAGRPADSPDLAAMALAVSDLPSGARIDKQRYYRDPDFVAAYEREFSIPGSRVGRSRLLLVFIGLSVDRTDTAARLKFETLRLLAGKKAFRDALAREIAGGAETPVKTVTVGRPRTVRAGDGAVALPISMKIQGLVLNVGITFMRVDRVLGTITHFGVPGQRVYNADADRLARASAARMAAGLVPTLKLPPIVSGTVQPGQVLSARSGTWTGDQLTFAHQWERCDSAGTACVPISGATATTYTVATGDLASTLRVTVVGRNRLGSVAASSTSTSVVAGSPGSPTVTVAPLVSGVVQVGQSLTVDTGGWAGSPTMFAYQWRRCNAAGGACLDIAGATTSAYTIATTESRSTLRVLVIATNPSGSGGAISAPTAAVP